MKWTDSAWKQIVPIYDKILELPFNVELSNGQLEQEKFLFYLAQDAYYLLEFGRTLSAISSRMNSGELVLAFAQSAIGAIVAERGLHESYFAEFGLKSQINPSPSTLLYTNYILNQAAYQSVEVAVAAVLPCFWIYKKVGDAIYSQQKGNDNPYKRWIDMYAGEDFAQAVEKIILITDDLASNASEDVRLKMMNAFETATKLEWMFWNSAYNLEEWPV